MFLLLDKVSEAKETATHDMFLHDMEGARSLKDLSVRHQGELEKTRADAMIEMAKVSRLWSYSCGSLCSLITYLFFPLRWSLTTFRSKVWS